MARRTKEVGIVDGFHELFFHVPAWWCIPVAVVAFLVIQIGIHLLAAANPILKGFTQVSTFFACGAAGLILFSGFVAAIKKWERRRLYDSQTGIESIRRLSWVDFELLIGEAYRRQGYHVTETGGGGADGGVDLILHKDGEKVLVQCKQWKVYKVGVKPVRELYGVLMAERTNGAIFVTSGVYTQEARSFAQGKPLGNH